MKHAFERPLRIRFSHCDPAGIVFVPQYLVLLNQLTEQWFDEALGLRYAQLIGARRTGLPTVRLNCKFTAISCIGDDVTLGLSVERIGSKSLSLLAGCRCADEQRMRVRQVLVFTSLDTHKAIPIPADVRAALDRFNAQPRSTAMQDKQILQPPAWRRRKGYANSVAGMISWDAEERFASDRLADQARQAMSNIVAVLAEAGAAPKHIVRMTWYVTDKREYLEQSREIGSAYRELIGDFGVAMTAVQVVALIEDRAKVEIEVTAVVPD